MDFLQDLKKIDENILEGNSDASDIKEFISTGNYALNLNLSGSIYGGIAAGRSTMFAGESAVGKSFLAQLIAGTAQKMGYDICVFDSEFAYSKSSILNFMDPNKAVIFQVDTIEDMRNKCFNLIKLVETKHTDKKIMIILDSVANLSTEKERKDIEVGHNANDMGGRAKIYKSMGRTLTSGLARINAPMLIINHVYANVSGYGEKEVIAGGSGPMYISSQIVQMSKSKIKDKDGKEVVGSALRYKIVKNRIIPPFLSGQIDINFKEGINKYYGLLNFAIKTGDIEPDKTRFYVKHLDKKYWEKDLYQSEVFTEEVLTNIDNWAKDNLKYATLRDITTDDVTTEETNAE